MSLTPNQSRHIRLPPDRFYWGVLEAAPPGGKRRTRKELDYLLEPFLPEPIDRVHAVYARLDHARTLACAMGCDALEDVQRSSAALTLRPVSVPEDLALNGVDPASLNLLTGAFEPQPVRTLKTAIAIQLGLVFVVLSLVLAVGLERRSRRSLSDASGVESTIESIYSEILGDKLLTSSQPPEMQLLAERRRLEQTRSDDAALSFELVDVSAELQSLLARWPNESHLTTELISITPTAVTVRAAVPIAEAEQATRSLQAWSDWRRAQPEVTNQRDSSILTIRFTRNRNDMRP